MVKAPALGAGDCEFEPRHPENTYDKMYTYNAKVVDITNGDTVVVDIDLGFGVWLRKQMVRMGQINNTELNFAAQDFLKDLVLNKNVLIRTKKRDNEDCNTWMGNVFLKDNNTLIDVSEEVLNKLK